MATFFVSHESAFAAVAFGTSGAVATGSTSLSVPYPASIAAGDLLVLAVGNKYPANAPTTPAGWTLVTNAQAIGGLGTAGNDRGQIYATVFVKQAVGTESGNLTVSVTGANTSMGRIFRYTKAAGAAWDYAATNGSDATAGTDWSVTGATDPGITSGDVVVVVSSANGNVVTSWAAETVSATGATFTTHTERQDSSSNTGNDMLLVVSDHTVTAGTASAAPVFTMTGTGSPSANSPTGPSVFLRLREVLPAVVSVNRLNADPTTAATVSWTVTFSVSVTGVDATAFALAASGLSGAYITTVTGSGTTWTVTANTGIGAGTLGLNQTGSGTVNPALSGTFTGQVYTISATPALAEYRMEEANWSGAAGEVVDSSGTYSAQAFNSANTSVATPALAGNPGTCRYGVFDNGSTITQGYVALPNSFPDLTTDFTVTAWINTTNNSIGGQRILIDDQGSGAGTGYGISLADGAAGRIRFYSRGIAPVILDSNYTIANNTWYFVAAVADMVNKKRTLYVYSAAGALLDATTEAAWTGGAWGTDSGPVSIGAETNASAEAPATFHFKGNLDEVRIYQKALSQAAVAAIAAQTHACAAVVAVPNHYELSLPTNSVACLPTTVTVTACTDASSPCTNPFAAASGKTAVLATNVGALGLTTVTFGATGVASTTLSYPAAPDGTPAVVTLSGEQTAASNPRQCCPNGTSCVVANSCSSTFNTAGFIFSATAGGSVATIPTQVAGITSSTYFLRAVKSSTTTQACEAALTGTTAVNFAYECNNPATCYASNLMSVNGGAATTIARNNNGSVASYLPVNMTFDANGNAPLTFNYSDAGQVKLWASKAAGGSLLSTLTGSSNSFAVKPHHFDITNIACTIVGAGTCAPVNVTGNNPAASSSAGAAFIQAGRSFKATVTAMNGAATPAATPSFGNETVAEGAELTSFNHLPGAGSAAAIGRVLSGFSGGAATLTDLAWNEVGVLQLRATLSNANGYLGSDIVNGKNSVVSAANPYVGRFIPDRFDTVVTPQGGGFAYSGNPTGPVPGQPFTVAVTAKNASATATSNYTNAGGYAKNINLSVPVGGATGQLYVDAVAGGSGAVPASKFLNLVPGEGKVNYSDATGKISFVFNSLPNAEQAIQIHAEDADTVTSSGSNGGINIRHGRLRLFNAFGSEAANLGLPLRAEYWTGNSWTTNSADSFTVVPAGSVALSGYTGTLSAVNLGTSHVSGTTLAGGQGSIVLTMPSPTATGSVDLAINLGAGAADQSCLTVHPATTGAAIPWLRSINGSCAITYDKDPSARGSFGVYAPETRKTIHVRELY